MKEKFYEVYKDKDGKPVLMNVYQISQIFNWSLEKTIKLYKHHEHILLPKLPIDFCFIKNN